MPKYISTGSVCIAALIAASYTYSAEAVELIGNVASKNTIKVTAQVSGVIQNNVLEVGSPIKHGAHLATIKDQEFQLELKRSEANLSLASADLKLKQSVYDRYKELRSNKNLSQHELDVAKADLDASKARLSLAKVDVDKAKLDLENTRIHSSIDGYVIERTINKGSWVDQGELIYQLINIDQVIIRLLASEFELRELTVGQPVTVWSEANPEVKVSATINRIGVKPDTKTHAYPIEIEVDNLKRLFKPGMSIHAITQVNSDK